MLTDCPTELWSSWLFRWLTPSLPGPPFWVDSCVLGGLQLRFFFLFSGDGLNQKKNFFEKRSILHLSHYVLAFQVMNDISVCCCVTESVWISIMSSKTLRLAYEAVETFSSEQKIQAGSLWEIPLILQGESFCLWVTLWNWLLQKI